jgi:hypothetical protein
MNTGLRFLAILSVVVLASACGKDDKADSPTVPEVVPDTVTTVAVDDPAPQSAPDVMSDTRTVPAMIPFDINDISVTDKDVGAFPFFEPPKGYKYVTPSLTTLDESISLKESYYHLYAFGIDRFYKIEGKVLRVALYNDKLKAPSEKDFLLVRRHYRDAITAAGGRMVFGRDAKTDETHGTSPQKENSAGSESLRNLRQVYVINMKDSETWFDVDCASKINCLFTVTQKGKK